MAEQPKKARFAGVLGTVAGAVVGFAVGAIVYTLLNPVLEASTGLLRELQGLAWNLVPGLTIIGALIGLLLGLAWRRRAHRRATTPTAER